RKGSIYKRSLDVLKDIKQLDKSMLTKSGLMVGLGETETELNETFADIREQGVDILTLGQYLKPTKDNLDVERYYSPDEFDMLKANAEALGFPFVFSGPWVRSSYLADIVFEKTILNNG
ncbi:lipoyl synthase, partial [bacterium]|nr:lipoyl synthase [bacterium]